MNNIFDILIHSGFTFFVNKEDVYCFSKKEDSFYKIYVFKNIDDSFEFIDTDYNTGVKSDLMKLLKIEETTEIEKASIVLPQSNYNFKQVISIIADFVVPEIEEYIYKQYQNVVFFSDLKKDKALVLAEPINVLFDDTSLFNVFAKKEISYGEEKEVNIYTGLNDFISFSDENKIDVLDVVINDTNCIGFNLNSYLTKQNLNLIFGPDNYLNAFKILMEISNQINDFNLSCVIHTTKIEVRFIDYSKRKINESINLINKFFNSNFCKINFNPKINRNNCNIVFENSFEIILNISKKLQEEIKIINIKTK